MYVVRIACASLFGILAILLALSQTALLSNHEEITAPERVGIFFLALCLAGSSWYYFRPRSHWDAKLACPNCKHTGRLSLSSLGQPRLSVIAWILGGFIGSLLYSHARRHHFHCASCNEDCDLRTPGGWLAAAWLLYLVLAVVVETYVRTNA
jgi:hypothetical protein